MSELADAAYQRVEDARIVLETLGKDYAPNTRENTRRFALHQKVIPGSETVIQLSTVYTTNKWKGYGK